MTTLQQPTEPEATPDVLHDPASDGCATAPTATQKVAQAKVVMRSGGSVVVPDEWDLEELSDHDLLAQLALDTRISQALAARSREAMEVYRRRRRADEAARREQDRSFTLTATEATVLEVAPLLGTDPGRVQTLVRETKMLIEDFPGLWQLCRTGRLEVYKARLVAEAALSRLTDADDVAALTLR